MSVELGFNLRQEYRLRVLRRKCCGEYFDIRKIKQQEDEE
jgi:hypothetical protein